MYPRGLRRGSRRGGRMLTLHRRRCFRFQLRTVMHIMCNILFRAFVVALVWTIGVTHDAKAAPGKGTLFGTDAVRGNLLTIDPQTGVGTVIGPTGVMSVPALAVDPTTGM